MPTDLLENRDRTQDQNLQDIIFTWCVAWNTSKQKERQTMARWGQPHSMRVSMTTDDVLGIHIT